MSMRQQFAKTAMDLLKADERVVVLLGDIGVHSFAEAAKLYPDRVRNIGILEQATVGVAAGLAQTGFIPIIHTIAPFLVERALEQIKVDFGYQGLGGNFVSVGASYDYAALGCTHHCPADVELMRSIPGSQVFVPGHAREFDSLLRGHYADGAVNYFRLSETENFTESYWPRGVVQEGSEATVIAVGPTLNKVLEAAAGLDVTVLYVTVVSPFDPVAFTKDIDFTRVLLVEPYYRGGLSQDILDAVYPSPVRLRSVGVPRRFLTNYGTRDEHDAAIWLTPENIRRELKELIAA